MGKLVLDNLNTDVQDFIHDGSSHGAETVASNLRLRIVAHPPQCRVDGVVTHWSGAGSC